MPNPFLGVRIPPELEAALAARARASGQSKSDIAIAALETYLGLPLCHERLTGIEQRLTALETMAREACRMQRDRHHRAVDRENSLGHSHHTEQ
ncbi:ribbon-helix-helix protein, copG family [Rubidibacter lacunae KORDI 51-2]|uniref:Ribbon-helix-helix protein, copG family n=1 Tax=Rubidibacter lacunae KORDI 51-2 TaxID=582515 RepID=U5DPL2_9CHRO|nr:ribbon-helix-helix protein, CopG family [Rubidibacter lacunae]ERN42807.1 ribbon-helix-helix protein, copG family [Rubidibacter lacunae KORDI 51-2]